MLDPPTAAVLLWACRLAAATTYTVSTTNPRDLSSALNSANTNPGRDRIVVSLPPGSTIQLAFLLPTVNDPLDFDGGGVVISGAQLTGAPSTVALQVAQFAPGSSMTNTTWANFPGSGVYWAASDGRMTSVTVTGCAQDGLRLVGDRNFIADSVFGNASVPGGHGNGDDGCCCCCGKKEGKDE